MIAALFVQKNGIYYGIDDVDPWDADRDARNYRGPHPVVAHPPCTRWCQLAGLVQARWGHRKGEDDGCFEFALDAVRRWGGVLEHPAYTAAWPAFGLPAPHPKGGWQHTLCGGAVCHVEQFWYGHPARKSTWLYAYTNAPLPKIRWGRVPSEHAPALVSNCGNSVPLDDPRMRVTGKQASATPIAFRDLLLDIARNHASPA